MDGGIHFKIRKMKEKTTKIQKIGNELFQSNYSEQRKLNDERIKEIIFSNIDRMGPRWISHFPVFLQTPQIARILWLNEVYTKALEVPGNFIEFGSQWGASLNSFVMFKMIYEPWNIGREVIGFSTFDKGFVSVEKKDGDFVKKGDYAVKKDWEEILNEIIEINTFLSPIGSKNNYKIIEGDVSVTFEKWLLDNPHAIISHAHFDMDVYKPTKDALELCIERMPKGAILIFDELNHTGHPGETIALNEVLGIKNLALRKSTFQPHAAYVIIE